MKNLRVAFVENYSEPYGDRRCGGLITCAIQLAEYGLDPVFVGPEKKYHLPGFKYYASFKDVCKDYDFIVFATPGSMTDELDARYLPMLKDITIPFAVQSHTAQDEWSMVHKDKYFEHKMFRFFMPMGPTMWRTMPLIDTYPFASHKSHIEIAKFKKTKDYIVSSARLTSVKRVIEFGKQFKGLHKAGYYPKIYGSVSSPFYRMALEELFAGKWKHYYGGEYKPSQLDDILGPVEYHWGCTCYSPRKRRTHIFEPRIETATLEAAERGCKIIVHGASTPQDYEGTVIMVDALDKELDLAYEIKHQKADPVAFANVFNQIHNNKEKKLLHKIRSVL